MRIDRLKVGIHRGVIAAVLLLISSVVYSGPKIISWVTANGVRAMYVHAPQIPMVEIRVMFDAGAARDGRLPGLAMLVNKVSIMGAAGSNADRLAESFESIGAKQNQGVLRDSAWYSLRSLSEEKYLSRAVQTLAKIIHSPDFNKADLERERKRALIKLKRRQQSPKDVAKRALYKAVFGEHPYAAMPEGTMAGVKAIGRKDLVRFHKKYYVGRNAVVAVVGAVDEQRARKLVEQLTGKLPAGEPAPALPEVKPLTEARTIRIKHPSTQTHIFFGQTGVRRGDPDYFALYLANHALGGSGLVSRLGVEVREKRGLSYSVYSYFLPMRRKGLYIMGMQTKNDKADEGVQVMREVLAEYLAKGMTRKEFIASKKNITGGFALRIDSNNKVAEYLAMIAFYRLPTSWLDDFPARIQALTLEQANQAFRRYVDPAKMVTIIVGGK